MIQITLAARDDIAAKQQTNLLAALGLAAGRAVIIPLAETPQKKESPKNFALRMAKTMIADAGQSQNITLAAYRVIACGQRILLPTLNEQIARSHLKLLSGRAHRIWTALALTRDGGSSSEPSCRIAESRVHVKKLDEAEISCLIARRQWLNQPGSYVWPSQDAALITRAQGAPGNLSGFPLATLAAMMPLLPLHDVKPMG